MEFTDEQYTAIDGWCSKEKRERLMKLVKDTDAQLVMELGIYGGSSLIPMAVACKQKGSGMVHGCDPWTQDASVVGFAEDSVHREWWSHLDHDLIFQSYQTQIKLFDVADYIGTHIVGSEDYRLINRFEDESLDILHIDGNHSEECATRDVTNWLPKVKKGGYIVFDDVSWPGTKKGQELLLEKCTEIERYSESRQVGPCLDYAIYHRIR
jgi:predicted O-methyltransferase YrrM